MQHISFKLKFLTPAFLGGACPKQEKCSPPVAELRAPSIIGSLRWWHRFLGRQDSEARIFGSVAGNSGHAAGFSVRILNAPEPVTKATPPATLNLSRSYFLYAQETAHPANLRASLPMDSQFEMILINRRLSSDDWKSLIATGTTFSWLGALGNRARRGFGALSVTEINGKAAVLSEPESLLTPDVTLAFPSECNPQEMFSDFAISAGNWLRKARNNLNKTGKRKSEYFGKISGNGDTRLASPILLRPWRTESGFRLMLIGPKHLVLELGEPSPASSRSIPTSTPSDPVSELLGPELTFDRFSTIKAAISEWQSEGRQDLIDRFIEVTQSGKYSGLRSHPWYPKR